MEAALVDRLRQACTDLPSLVAKHDAVVGHILFTSVVVEMDNTGIELKAQMIGGRLRRPRGKSAGRPDLPGFLGSQEVLYEA